METTIKTNTQRLAPLFTAGLTSAATRRGLEAMARPRPLAERRTRKPSAAASIIAASAVANARWTAERDREANPIVNSVAGIALGMFYEEVLHAATELGREDWPAGSEPHMRRTMREWAAYERRQRMNMGRRFSLYASMVDHACDELRQPALMVRLAFNRRMLAERRPHPYAQAAVCTATAMLTIGTRVIGNMLQLLAKELGDGVAKTYRLHLAPELARAWDGVLRTACPQQGNVELSDTSNDLGQACIACVKAMGNEDLLRRAQLHAIRENADILTPQELEDAERELTNPNTTSR